MTVKTNSFEGGVSTAAVTAANSGGLSGDAFNNIYLSGTSTLNFDDTTPLKGGMSLSVNMASGGFAQYEYIGFNGSFTAGTRSGLGYRKSLRFEGTWLGGAVVTNFIELRNSAGVKVAYCKFVTATTSGKIAVFDASSDTTPVYTSTLALTPGSDYDVALYAENGTTTSNGRIEFGIYPKGSNTPTELMTAKTNANTAILALTTARGGKCVNSTQTGILRIDSLQVGDTFTTLPSATASNPTGTATVATRVVVDAGSYTGSGGGLSYAVTYVSGPTLTSVVDGDMVFFTPSTTADSTYTLTVTESGGGATSQNVVIPALTGGGSTASNYTQSLVWSGSAWVSPT